MAVASLPSTPPKSRPLFHYTTAQGLLGIIEHRCLFATHADFSNDSSECKLVLPHVKSILSAEYARLVPKLIELKILDQNILREHGNAVFEDEAQKSVTAMLEAVNNTAPYFITSFCIHNEGAYEYSNGLLSQWRSYALGGFAIEFDELEIDRLNKEESTGWRYQGIITDTVSYKDHEARVKPDQFKRMAGAFLRSILPRFQFLSANQRKERDEILGTAKINDFAQAFLSVAPFLKHSGFEEEAEYRIVALCNRLTIFDPGDERKIKHFRFRSSPEGNVVPYIALYDGLQKPLPIKAIIIGPHAQQENQRMAVELLLERHEIKAEIRVSELPFRE
jgi:hypothetical protein